VEIHHESIKGDVAAFSLRHVQRGDDPGDATRRHLPSEGADKPALKVRVDAEVVTLGQARVIAQPTRLGFRHWTATSRSRRLRLDLVLCAVAHLC
jgi:hypothetical protein